MYARAAHAGSKIAAPGAYFCNHPYIGLQERVLQPPNYRAGELFFPIGRAECLPESCHIYKAWSRQFVLAVQLRFSRKERLFECVYDIHK